MRLNAVKPRKSVGKNPQQSKSCLEELTRLTLERRRDLKTAKDMMKTPSIIEQNYSNERTILQPQRFRRQTLCHGEVLGVKCMRLNNRVVKNTVTICCS